MGGFSGRQIRHADGQIDHIETGSYFEDVFHHAFAIATPAQTLILPASWGSALTPLLHNPGMALFSWQYHCVSKTFEVSRINYTVVVSEDMSALRSSQAELHAWTAVVSLLLVILLASIIWLGIYLAMRPVLSSNPRWNNCRKEISRMRLRPRGFRPLVAQIESASRFP